MHIKFEPLSPSISESHSRTNAWTDRQTDGRSQCVMQLTTRTEISVIM